MSPFVSRLRVVLVTDRTAAARSLETAVSRALAGGATAVMLREKDLRGAALLPLARALRKATRAAGAALIVNERVDVALAARADGVHLGSDAMPTAAARRMSKRLRAGISVHSAAEGIARARAERPDYVLLGPVFRTPDRPGSKKAPPVGLDAVSRLAARVPVPVVAIGGVDATNAARVVAAGAAGVAAIRAFFGADDPRDAAASLAAAVRSGLAERRRAGKGRRP